MKEISIVCLLLLTACAVFEKDKEEFKKIGHDVVDEGVENVGK